MEAPPNIASKKEQEMTFKKSTSEKENFTLNIKIKDYYTIYLSLLFEGDDKTYEDMKTYEDIKQQQPRFIGYTLEEIYEEITDLISNDKFEINKGGEQIFINILLPLKKKKTLDFVLEINKFENITNANFKQIIKEKNDIIKELKEIIKQKDKIIRSLENIINPNKGIKEKEEDTEGIKDKNLDYNKIFHGFNIINKTPKHKLTKYENSSFYTIIQLQDGRLASGGNDGSIVIYNQKTFEQEMIIKEHTQSIYDLIQLKNGNLVSCSNDDKKMNEYQIYENNTYKLISQVTVAKYGDKGNNLYKIQELENGEIGLVAYNLIIFYLNLNNKLDEDFKIVASDEQIGNYIDMMVVKPDELVIVGGKDKIQFFDIKSRQLKEIISFNRDIRWIPGNVLCMLNERCLCIGGKEKITIIDIHNKNIIQEVQHNFVHYCLLKLNDNILLTGSDKGEIIQWEIKENKLTFLNKKEKAHQTYIYEIIKFNNFIISCSYDGSIKVW